MRITKIATALTVIMAANPVFSAELEVSHWWTAPGEAAAVAVLAKELEAKTDNTWKDGAIAGGQNTALPVIVNRIVGGDPMGAAILNHGRAAEDLVQSDLMLDLTDVAEANNWGDVVNPNSLLESCTYEGRIYCAPLNVQSSQWMWTSKAAYESIGIPAPTNWNELVETAPKLREAGLIPLAMGSQSWQGRLTFETLMVSLIPADVYMEVYEKKNVDVAGGPEMAKVFQAAAKARELSEGNSVESWNEATGLLINGKAGAQIMGSWTQAEFTAAGKEAGKDYGCLPALGVGESLVTGGDAVYFPVNDDPEVTKAQKELAALLLDPQVQVDFNSVKGSLPVRSDVDLENANECIQEGITILKKDLGIPSSAQLVTSDTRLQFEDLFVSFFADPDMTPEDAQAKFVDIIANAE